MFDDDALARSAADMGPLGPMPKERQTTAKRRQGKSRLYAVIDSAPEEEPNDKGLSSVLMGDVGHEAGLNMLAAAWHKNRM